MTWTKIIIFNVGLVFSLLGGLLLIPPSAYALREFVITKFPATFSDSRESQKIYEDTTWAKRHFSELRDLSTTYHDFIMWRRNDFVGQTINIVDGLRQSIEKPTSTTLGHFAFFGGSTLWGTGVNDALTIPSQFASSANTSVINFGETGYNTRQSLETLINALVTKKLASSNSPPTTVVFYGGAVDYFKCQVGSDLLGTKRQSQIRNFIEGMKNGNKYSFENTFAQLTGMLKKITQSLKSNSHRFDCDTDLKKAENISNMIVQTWSMANSISQYYGMKFIAVLEPIRISSVDEISDSKKGDFDITQYQELARLIVTKMEETNVKFLDLSQKIVSCRDCFIDAVHLSHRGTFSISKEILEFIRSDK